MNCQVSLHSLQTALQQMTGVSVKQVSLPILSTILLEVTDKQLILRATNLNVGVEAQLKATVEKQGTVAVEAQVLQKLFQSVSGNGEVNLELKQGVLVVTAPTVTAKIKTLPPDEFPTLPYQAEGATSFSVDVEHLVSGIKSVAYAAAVSDIKPEIASVYMYNDQEELVFVATDSFRLAEKRVKVKQVPVIDGVLIPVKNINEIMRILGTISGEVEIILADHQIAFKTKDLYVVSRVIAGVFPDYKQIIPKDLTTQVVALKADIVNLLKVTSVFSDQLQKLTITVNPAAKNCSFVTGNDEFGTQESQLEASLTGDAVTLMVNQRYVQECLQSIAVDSVTISCAQGRPMLLSGIGDQTFLYLVMPMRQ